MTGRTCLIDYNSVLHIEPKEPGLVWTVNYDEDKIRTQVEDFLNENTDDQSTQKDITIRFLSGNVDMIKQVTGIVNEYLYKKSILPEKINYEFDTLYNHTCILEELNKATDNLLAETDDELNKIIQKKFGNEFDDIEIKKRIVPKDEELKEEQTFSMRLNIPYEIIFTKGEIPIYTGTDASIPVRVTAPTMDYDRPQVEKEIFIDHRQLDKIYTSVKIDNPEGLTLKELYDSFKPSDIKMLENDYDNLFKAISIYGLAERDGEQIKIDEPYKSDETGNLIIEFRYYVPYIDRCVDMLNKEILGIIKSDNREYCFTDISSY